MICGCGLVSSVFQMEMICAVCVKKRVTGDRNCHLQSSALLLEVMKVNTLHCGKEPCDMCMRTGISSVNL